MTQTLDRRAFLRGVRTLGLGLAAGGLSAPGLLRAATDRIVIVSNPGLENATLNTMIEDGRFLEKYSAKARIVMAKGAAGPFDAIVAGKADVCMISGYNGALPRMAQGAKVKFIGSAMRKTALAIYAKPKAVTTLKDLEDRTVAVGPRSGLLSVLTRQRLTEAGVNLTKVDFVDKGSNEKAYQSVVHGEADACCSSISHLNDKDSLHVVEGGQLWSSLPDYVFQTAYASDAVLGDRREELIPVLAAFGEFYDYLMKPEAKDEFFAARKRARKSFDANSAEAVWRFDQAEKPYSPDLTLSENDVGYRQKVLIDQGLLKVRQPFDQVADMSAAQAAAKLRG